MEQRQWTPSAETAFIRFARGKDVDNPKSKGDLITFRYFCQDMMWRIDGVKYSEFLVDTIEDFRNTGMEKKRDISFIQTRLDRVKELDSQDNCSYDRVVRALIWLYDPNSPVNSLYESKDNEKKVEMACRLAGIIVSDNKMHPSTVRHIKTLENDLMLSTAMCIRHILYSGQAGFILAAEDLLLMLEVKVFAMAKSTSSIDEAKKAVEFLKGVRIERTNLQKDYDKLYGAMSDNPELRIKGEIKRRKNAVERVKDYRDLATVEEEITKPVSSESTDEWMIDDDGSLY